MEPVSWGSYETSGWPDLTTIENEIAEILKPSKKDREKTKSYKKNLREMIAIFGEFRDSQLQIEQESRRSVRQSAKEVLSDTGSDQVVVSSRR